MQIPKEAQTRQERRCASARPDTSKHAATRVELMPQGHTHHAREVCATCRRHVRWLPKPGTVERQRLNAFCLARLGMCEWLNPWERNFVHHVSQQRKLSPRQQVLVERLCRGILGGANMNDQLPAFLQDMLARLRKPVRASTAGFSGSPGNFMRICPLSKL